MDTESLLARLESVTKRLEAVARKQGAPGDDDEDGPPAYVTDFQNLVNNEVAKFKAICDKTAAACSPLIDTAYNNVLQLLVATSKCKKPKNQKDMMDLLAPTVKVIADAELLKRKRSKLDKHFSAFYELMVSLSWVTMAPPYGLPLEHVKAQGDSCMFHLNKILMASKDQGAKGQDNKDFVNAMKAINAAMATYVKNYFKTGLEWNPKGGELADYTPGAAPAAKAAAPEPKKEEPKKKAAPKKKPAAGGVANIMGELKKRAAGGDSAATGMKKVTRDMKNKYKDPKERSGKVTMKVKKAAVKKPSKPAEQVNRGGAWFIQNYYESEVVEVTDKITVKQTAYFANCSNATFDLKQKVKAITVDSCQKIRIFVTAALASIDMVNCKGVTLILRGPVPTIQLDKCQSPRIIILKEAMDPIPRIISSNISAGNVEIPGATEDADPVEIPLPEQFESVIDPEAKKLSTHPVTHG